MLVLVADVQDAASIAGYNQLQFGQYYFFVSSFSVVSKIHF